MNLRAYFACAVAVVGMAAISGCHDDTAKPADKPPTKADITRDAGLTFPDGFSDFKVVRAMPTLIDVTFSCTPEICDQFDRDNALQLAPGRRVITSPSPLWDLNVGVTIPNSPSTSLLSNASYRGSSTSYQDVTRDIELVNGTIRISLHPNAGAGATTPATT